MVCGDPGGSKSYRNLGELLMVTKVPRNIDVVRAFWHLQGLEGRSQQFRSLTNSLEFGTNLWNFVESLPPLKYFRNFYIPDPREQFKSSKVQVQKVFRIIRTFRFSRAKYFRIP